LPADDIVSQQTKQDTHFINIFSLVIGVLAAIAIAIFVFARDVASHTQDQQVLVEAQYLKSTNGRIEPFSHEAVAGQDNSQLAMKADTGAAATSGTAAIPKDGAEVFQQVCSACHGTGLAGAPKAGDSAAWAPRIAKGKDALYQHALQGFQGTAGVMPPKGGRVDLPDALVKAAVDHMVGMAQK
jgi:cytochrome c5